MRRLQEAATPARIAAWRPERRGPSWASSCWPCFLLMCTTYGTAAGQIPALQRATADVETTLYLIGDAGAPRPGSEPVLEALAADIAANEARSVVAFLGDNVYPDGVPPAGDPGYHEAVRRLTAQVRAVTEAGAEAIFVPGNHDWNYTGDDGLERVRAQERLVESMAGERAQLLPDDGCPGPGVRDVGAHLRLVALDTQWWLQDEAVRGNPVRCTSRSEGEATTRIEAALRGAEGRHVVVLAHHPLRSGGPHGGHFTWQQHVFPLRELAGWAWLPLPIIGSVYPMVRGSGVSDQDLAGGGNERMRQALEASLAVKPPLVYASGHEHSLQVLRGGSARRLVVSGAGTWGHMTSVRYTDETLWAEAQAGYVRLDVQRDGGVRLGVIVVDEQGTGREAFAELLQAGS